MTVKVIINLRGLKLIEPKIFRAVGEGIKKRSQWIERDARLFAPRQYGFLKASIHALQKGKFKWEIGSHLFYAEYMERPGNVRIEGRRPWMEPALDKHIPLIAESIMKEIRKVLG